MRHDVYKTFANKPSVFPNMVLGKTEYSNAMTACYTFQPLWLSVRLSIMIRLNLEIQLTIKISEKTEERRFGVILAPFSS